MLSTNPVFLQASHRPRHEEGGISAAGYLLPLSFAGNRLLDGDSVRFSRRAPNTSVMPVFVLLITSNLARRSMREPWPRIDGLGSNWHNALVHVGQWHFGCWVGADVPRTSLKMSKSGPKRPPLCVVGARLDSAYAHGVSTRLHGRSLRDRKIHGRS